MPINIPDNDKYLELKYERMVKIIKDRLIGVTDPFVHKIVKEFGLNVFRRCSAPADYAEKVFELCLKDKGYKSVLEIGTLNGITSALMAQYVDNVYTIDIKDSMIKYDIWKHLGVDNKIKSYIIDNEIEKADIINGLDFDLVYIDGDHLHCTWSDFFLTRHCGRALIHESILESSEPWKLVKALPPEEIEYFQFRRLKKCSVAYWQKK